MDIILNFFKEYWAQILFFSSLLVGFYRFATAMIEATKCSLRNDILDIYDRCKIEKKMTKYQFESLELSYKQYKALGGNSFVDAIHLKIQNYTIID